MINWTTHRIGNDPGVTLHRLDSGRPGPRMVVLAGVHGNEIGSITGVGRLTGQSLPLTAGSLDVVPVVHEAAHAAFIRTGPTDGLDLARTFPGDATGSPTERLAALVLAEVITGADALLDLHTSSPDADLPLFAGAYAADDELGDRSAALATHFGLGTVWTHPATGPGRTLTMAAELGIPAMYVESPTGGVLAEDVVRRYTDGVLRVARFLGILPDHVVDDGEAVQLWLHGSGDTDSFRPAEQDGHFVADRALLEPVRTGDTVGRVLDSAGATLAEVTAPQDGRIVFLRRTARVTAGTALVSVCPELPSGRPLSRPTDRHPA